MEQVSDLSRRDFLKTGAKTTAGVATLGGITFLAHPERVFGANDRVRVAVCGVHGRGMDHVRGFRHLKNAEVAAICDADENVMGQRLPQIEKLGIDKPRTFVDIRKLLEDKSIDAISIATPNHWHALMGIWACQAGKDVYIEKPCCHNLWEGKQLVKAAAKYGRIVQHGTQIRSAPALQEAVRRMHEGLLGEVYMARGLCFKWRKTIGRALEEAVPSGVHYDLWTGPAKLLPFSKNHFHYNWHWNWNYGNGDLGNQCVHQVDVARWGMGVGFPNRVSAAGGHFMFDDDQQTPNTLSCGFEYDMPDGKRKMLEIEVRHWITNREAGIGSASFGKPQGPVPTTGMGAIQGDRNTIGDIFYGSAGCLATGDEDVCAFQTWIGENQEPGPRQQAAGDHYANFVECVISRKKENLNAPIEEGYISAGIVHLANVSYRLRRSLKFDPVTETVIGDEEANNLLRDGDRGYRTPYQVPEEI
ncbi:MAG TPA: Gfo/Idh/MocA family oxidoreductase [Acidobacteriota bacterium]|nr:Gfo/Idh/MocA family oxidoreductase [Acidobacteriota bacterium]